MLFEKKHQAHSAITCLKFHCPEQITLQLHTFKHIYNRLQQTACLRVSGGDDEMGFYNFSNR